MANSVNGQAAIASDSHRRPSGIVAHTFRRPHLGEVLSAFLLIDTTEDFVIDSPIVGTNTTGQRIYVVGLEFQPEFASTILFKSKVGSDSAVTLREYNVAANGGVDHTADICRRLFNTEQDGTLIINASDVSGTDILAVGIDYVIADSMVPQR